MTDQNTVATAVAAIMGDITKIPRSAMNQHGKYNYASIDDFLDAVRPLMAKHGLIILMNEESQEVAEGGWLRSVFGFKIMAGSEVIDGGKRTVAVNGKMGSQAYGAAQSYALKQYLRALFMIATGEKSDDESVLEPSQLPPQNSLSANWKGPLVKGVLTDRMKIYIDRIESAETLEVLYALGDMMAVSPDDIRKEYKDEWPAGMSFNEVVAQCEHDAPGWIDGNRMPELFVPFRDRMNAALDRLGANDPDD